MQTGDGRTAGVQSAPASSWSLRLVRAMTVLELTVVITMLLVIVSITLLGAGAWKRGVDRARCIMNIRQMQVSLRSYANLKEYEPGFDLTEEDPDLSLLGELVGPGKFVPELPRCPSGGWYFYGGDVIPPVGALYTNCSLSGSEEHRPAKHGGW